MSEQPLPGHGHAGQAGWLKPTTRSSSCIGGGGRVGGGGVVTTVTDAAVATVAAASAAAAAAAAASVAATHVEDAEGHPDLHPVGQIEADAASERKRDKVGLEEPARSTGLAFRWHIDRWGCTRLVIVAPALFLPR